MSADGKKSGGGSGKTRTIAVNYLARVEGEGGLKVVVKGGKVTDVQLNIFEPPRFFEAMLRGRHFAEAPDITSRICGICPIAYQMTATAAIESALGIEAHPMVKLLRRLIYCGEWIESHGLHVYLLHAPDFLGYDSAVHMAREYPDVVKRGLALKKVGNDLMTLLGGREIHPINVRIGGFYRAPDERELAPIAERLAWAREAAEETVRWVSGFTFPAWERDYELVSVRATQPVYPIEEGTIVSSGGLRLRADEYETRFAETHVAHSTALHSTLDGKEYLVGPLARLSLNFERLSERARNAALAAGFSPPFRNPFKSIIARSVEILYACDEALRLIAAYRRPDVPFVEAVPRESTGHAVTEAPRGLIYHRYRLGADGLITDARIVPPTSQNQKSIENDLRHFVEAHLKLARKELSWQCEQAVRNYDPCISCAAHFLEVKWEETT